MFFVFAAMLEFALVLLFKRRTDWKNISPKVNDVLRKQFKEKSGIQSIFLTNQEVKSGKNREHRIGTNENNTWLDQQYKKATKIDLAAFVIFSALYLVFNFVYFSCFFEEF